MAVRDADFSELRFIVYRQGTYRSKSALLSVIIALLRRILRTGVRVSVLVSIILPISIRVGTLLLLVSYEGLIDPLDPSSTDEECRDD